VFRVEGQPEQVVRGEKLAQVLRVLALLVDLGGPGRYALGDDLADRRAKVDELLRQRVGGGELGDRGHRLGA
jgi:hypothetical protein